MSVFLDLLRCILCCEEEDPRPYRQDHDVTRLIRNRFQSPTTTTDYTQIPSYDPHPRTISPANSTYFINAHTTTRIQSPFSSVASNFPNATTTPSAVTKPRIETPKRHPQPQVSAANSTTTLSAVAKPIIETPKRHPQPQVSAANSTTPSAVAKPKTETPKRTLPAPDAYSTTDQKLTRKSSLKPPPSRPDLSLASASSSSSFGTPQLSFKPILSQALLNPTIPQTKTNYVWVEKGATPLYMIPEDIKGLIQKDIVPGVLKKPLSPSSYTEYFDTLLYAENDYLELMRANGSYHFLANFFECSDSTSTPHPNSQKKRGNDKIRLEPINVFEQQCHLFPNGWYFFQTWALLYMKWDGFEMENVSLQLHKAAIYGWKSKNKHLNRSDENEDKIFVAFEIDSVPERRPFLLSRDFASVQPSGGKVGPFQGIIYRVVKSNLVLVEFGEDFHSQYYSSCKYDVKFSFNRVCLKRAHQAIAAVSDVLLRKFLFPKQLPKIYPIQTQVFVNHKLDTEQANAVRYILNLQHPPPYLVEGPLSVTNTKERPQYASNSKELSRTGVVVREAILHIFRTTPSSRILICAPLNSTCDMVMRSLKKEIPESDMFRANAAFREVDGVPIDILPSCLYKGECFSCPSLKELKKYKVILSTFMSSFRLHGEGIVAGHFSHIFLVDASCATEPETLVPLANLANERTAVVITGAPQSRSGWVHSNIARRYGLMTSYFERLREIKAYKSLDPNYITQLKDAGRKSDDRYNSLSFI
ncbi:hypothetical protein LguiA_008332 [Lonicera macranthoides]